MEPSVTDHPDPITVKVKHGRIFVDQEPVYVWGPNAKLTWKLVGSGYKLTSNSISIAGGAEVFRWASGDDRSQVWDNSNPGAADFKYTIRVFSTNGQDDPPPLDPKIGNQG